MLKKLNKAYDIYDKAILYEYEKNCIYEKVFNIPKILRYIPNIYLKFSTKKRNSFYKLSKIIYKYVVGFAYPIFSIIKFCKSLFYLKGSRTYIEKGSSIYLGCSEDKYFSYIDSSKDSYPLVYIAVNNRNISAKNEKLRVSNMKNILTLNDLLYALLFSLTIPFKLRTLKLYLFCYYSFDWFLLYRVLVKIKPNEIWVSNHYDRWTILASELYPVTLVQHGTLYYKDENENILFPEFSYGVNNVKRLFVLDDKSELFYKKYIKNNDVKVEKIHLKTNLIKWPVTNKLRVLFIGTKVLAGAQSRLIHKYMKLFDDCVFAYKYHPLQMDSLFNNKIIEIDVKNKIIESDIVVTYGSSIDDEIAMLYEAKFIKINDYTNIDVYKFKNLLYD